MNLRRKIYCLAGAAALLPVAALLCLMAGFERRVSREAERELTGLAQASVAQTARDVYGLCETTNALLERKVSQNLAVAHLILAQKGGLSAGGAADNWDAVEQLSGKVERVSLPGALLGGRPVPRNRSFETPVAVVDDVARAVGSAVSVFQRMNEQGDMLRIATTVPGRDGQRATGTYIAARNPDGSPNAVVAAVLRGDTYRGAAFVVEEWYVAAYEPLRDASGRIAGMLFVGERLAGIEPLRRTIMQIGIGQTGHIVVIGCKGRQRGRYVISKDGKRDGESIWESRDATGQLFVQQLVEKAMSLPKGQTELTSYLWQNPGEAAPRRKLSAVVYFEPWDWLINASAYEDEFHAAIRGLSGTLEKLKWLVVAGGVCALALAVAAAIYMGGRLSRPIELVTRLARKIAGGDVHGAKTEFAALEGRARPAREPSAGRRNGGDESEHLLESFRTMTETLDGLIGQVQRSGIQVTTSATEIAASARQLEATVAEQAASTREVSATTAEISSTANDLLRTMNEVNETVSEAADRAESGRGELGRMEEEMRLLVKATASISSRLGVINDRAAKISTVVTTINKISDQTALLALNAAIEAEKAGEYGKGFSVVAREISRLADQTAVATQDIENVVKEMQSSVSGGVMEMDKFSEEVRRRVEDVSKIAGQLGLIIDRVRELGPEFESTKDGMNAQTSAAQQISEAMSQLSMTADQTRESLREFKQATEQLNAAVQGLQGQVSRFRIGA
ncbi:MAG: methyl-accepting chemotaxis protein [Bryobacteraceae bacterium]|nr:methyl-accepting chemotaxis protein [Bryobacteraceae bacterium]